MRNKLVKNLRTQVTAYQKRIDSTLVELTAALSFWFEKLNSAKIDLLKYGKLAVIVDEVTSSEN